MTSQSLCPCGGIILADTDECRTMLCIECADQIAKVMLIKDQNYNEGFIAGKSSKPEWPSLEDVELHLAGNTQYYLGVQDCYRFLKQRMNQNEKGAIK